MASVHGLDVSGCVIEPLSPEQAPENPPGLLAAQRTLEQHRGIVDFESCAIVDQDLLQLHKKRAVVFVKRVLPRADSRRRVVVEWISLCVSVFSPALRQSCAESLLRNPEQIDVWQHQALCQCRATYSLG
eukprot:2004566-Rhodomonas_salina.3